MWANKIICERYGKQLLASISLEVEWAEKEDTIADLTDLRSEIL